MPLTVVRKAQDMHRGASVPDQEAPGGLTRLILGKDAADPRRLTQQYARARADAERANRDGPGGGDGRAWLNGVTLGTADEIVGGAKYAMTGVRNLLGAGPGYSAGDAYRAEVDTDRAKLATFHKAHPVRAAAGEIVGGLMTPGLGEAGGFIKGSKTLAGMAGRSAVVAGGLGAAAGAGNGDDTVSSRVHGGLIGGTAGATVGGLIPPASRVVVGGARRAGSAVVEAVTAARRAGGHSFEPPQLTPRQQAIAKDNAVTFVDQVRQSARKSLDDLDNHPAEAMGKPVTAAEALGRSGMYHLGTAGRRTGATGEELEGFLQARQQATGDRILGDITKTLGVHPEAARGNVEAIVEQGQAKARPLYDAALSDPTGIVHPRFEELASRPIVRQAIRSVSDRLRNSGVNPQGYGFVDMEDPAGWASDAAPGGLPDSVGTLSTRGTSVAAQGRGPSLLQFVSKNGGVRDPGGELAALDADQGRVGIHRIVRPFGADLEDMARQAHEAGYFPEHGPATMDSADNMHPVTPEHLKDAIRAELAGRPRYASAGNQSAMDKAAGVDQAAELTYRGGSPDDLPSPDDYGGRPMPESEPVRATGYTPEAWDMIKKELGKLVQRHPLTGAPVPDSVSSGNQGITAASRDITAAMREHVPGYADALNTSGDYLSVRSAFDRVRGSVFSSNMPHVDFERMWNSLTPGEQEAGRSAIATDAVEMAQKGGLKPRIFSTPVVKSKLQTAFGADKTTALIGRVEQEASLAKGNRMMPGTNSVTTEGLLADQEQADNGLLPKAFKQAVTGNTHGLMDTLGGAALSAVTVPLRGLRAPINEASRDEVGRLLLLKPSQLADELRSYYAQDPAGPKALVSPYLPPFIAGQTGADSSGLLASPD